MTGGGGGPLDPGYWTMCCGRVLVGLGLGDGDSLGRGGKGRIGPPGLSVGMGGPSGGMDGVVDGAPGVGVGVVGGGLSHSCRFPAKVGTGNGSGG
ncbi:MAG TPA: hypothetical protein VE465_23585, partial [Streptosporangiaceae bacterium]|nr:hypothetical protein [Streptosporangiaceae bacterium]